MGETFLGEDLLAWLVLAFGGAMLVGNVAALVRPPARPRPGELSRAPLGRSLVFASAHAGHRGLFAVSASGGTPRPLAGGASRLEHPSASRDGSVVAYEDWGEEAAPGASRIVALTREP